jgi:hypothetical protein
MMRLNAPTDSLKGMAGFGGRGGGLAAQPARSTKREQKRVIRM